MKDKKVLIPFEIIEFAYKIASALKESRSSTALFFVQQAYPDTIDGLDQISTDDLLDNVINQSLIIMKDLTEQSSPEGKETT